MRAILGTLAVTFALVLIAATVFVFSGFYDVSATAPTGGSRSGSWIQHVSARSRRMRPVSRCRPVLAIRLKSRSASTTSLPIAPSVTARRACPKATLPRGSIRSRPILAESAKRCSPAELFWIGKHGIKMNGMPAWSDHSDAELWSTVAFLKRLPGMSEQGYATLLMASIAHGGHHHTDDGTKAPGG
jgi:hypothetical protein